LKKISLLVHCKRTHIELIWFIS